MENLTAPQRIAFTEALVSAFPTYEHLDFMMDLQLNYPLTNITPQDGMPIVARKVVRWANSAGEVDSLLAAAIRETPKNPKLKALSFELLLNGTKSASSTLEAIVKPNVPMQDPIAWRARMEQLEQCVCRIEFASGQPIGSGFLVADDLILTNYHVMQLVASNGKTNDDCVARFGARVGAEGAQEGETVALAPEPLVAESPVSQLDFVLVRLSKTMDRTFITPPSPHAFAEGDIYFILQHPLGQEMKLSAGVFSCHRPEQNRIDYTANTNPGSSGSPVFDVSWNPVALHHAGSTAANTGVILTAVSNEDSVSKSWVDKQ